LKVEWKKDMEKRIDLSSRRNILDAFLVTKISWYGKLEQVNFLGRLFDLSKIKSNDSRYKTADEDIFKHTVANDDWPDEWVFTDSRFNLLHEQDQLFLDFLCLTIHPTVRENPEQIVTLLEIFNNNLKKFGLEIIEGEKIPSKPIYKVKEIRKIEEPIKPNSTKETRLALVVGCSNYIFAGNLANPTNDSNSMEVILQKLGFDVIKLINPTQKDLKISIDEFGEKLRGYKVGLFYFAGHGVQLKGLNYLIPIDANLKTEKMVEYDCVEANRVLRYMEESKADVSIMILDACRDNPFERSWSRGIGLRGLTTMNAPKGSLIAYSTSPGKTASDGNGSNGLYTDALLRHIDGKSITIITMFQNVRIDVIQKSNNEQIPWETTSLTADYYFNP
jgi:hypothetical protein